MQWQLMNQETVSTWTEGMMEQSTFTGEGLLHCLQQWASTAVKFQTLMMLSIDFVYISVSSLNCTKFVSIANYTCCKQYSW